MREEVGLKKVNVLLSAYNGERYIAEQIDSILNQTYENIEIYVRDDGSKDGTAEILKKYESQGKIHLFLESNVGFVHSFEDLMIKSGDADYYAFCDQDDVWLPEKIAVAVELLEKEEQSQPVLYFSNYDYYDSDLIFQEHHVMEQPNISFQNSLVDCVSLGFNSVFNKVARDMVVDNMPKHSLGHDWWMYMVCAAFGKVIYDSRVTVKYRRHQSNVSSAGMGFLQFQIWRFKKFFLNGYFKKIRMQIQEFKNIYYAELNSDKQRIINLFRERGFHPLLEIRKIFYPYRFRQSVADEIFVRAIFLIGQL